MEFFVWWFDSHPVWSTLLSPFWALIWALYTNNALKVVWCITWIITWTLIRVGVKAVEKK